MPSYPSSLTDSEWGILHPLLPVESSMSQRGRPPEHTRRSIIDGILYIIRTGGAWRMMPNDLPHWKTCYHYFRIWAKQGIWEKIHHTLRDKVRLASGKKAPTAAILDSQSVRTASQPGVRGFDAGKKITGRKRHVLVDTLGNILALKVTSLIHNRFKSDPAKNPRLETGLPHRARPEEETTPGAGTHPGTRSLRGPTKQGVPDLPGRADFFLSDPFHGDRIREQMPLV